MPDSPGPLDRALAALSELKSLSLPAAAGSSEEAGAPSSESAGGASATGITTPPLAGDPAAGAVQPPAPKAPDCTPFKADILPELEGPARAWFTAQGVKFVPSDTGDVPSIELKDGTRKPYSYEALRSVAPDVFLRPLGKAGTGLTTGGGVMYAPDPFSYLATQEGFEKHKDEVLRALADRNRKRSSGGDE